MAKYFVQLVISGARVLGRAFAQAVKEEYASSQRVADARRNSTSSGSEQNTYVQNAGISLDEAKQILNVKDIHDSSSLNKQFEHLFSSNSKDKGGSFYLQSKVFRAKERIDEELQFEKSERRRNPGSENKQSRT
uniref:Mitochondrial import inner membrane translocase subunit TIM16 n=1 Tax=Schistosoma japonicum TaxID=6182 RepID=C1L5V7_SCHJA|nr:Mitochondrial import inner membrane translocase subunit TIM16 [Schistosoma japonicum]